MACSTASRPTDRPSSRGQRRGVPLSVILLRALAGLAALAADRAVAQPAVPPCGGATIATGDVTRVIDGKSFVLADGKRGAARRHRGTAAVGRRSQRGARRRRQRRQGGPGRAVGAPFRRSQVGGDRPGPLRPADRPRFHHRRSARNLGPVRNFDKRLCAGSPGWGQSRMPVISSRRRTQGAGRTCLACGANPIM